MNDQELKDWLNQEPEVVKQNEDGSEYVDIVAIEEMLDEIDPCWGIENFKCARESVTLKFPDGTNPALDYATGTGELVITMYGKTRYISGACTVKIAQDITHYSPTVLSEVIKNAAKKLGRRAGKYLNDRGAQSAPASVPITGRAKGKPAPVLLPPDASIKQQFSIAVLNGDERKINLLKQIYDFDAQA